MPELDINSIAQSVRAEAERKIEVLEQIVDTHTSITTARDEFLAADTAGVSTLSALLAEAEKHGVDAKMLRGFKVDPLTAAATPRRRGTGAPRGRRSSTTSPTPASTPLADNTRFENTSGDGSTDPVGDRSLAASA